MINKKLERFLFGNKKDSKLIFLENYFDYPNFYHASIISSPKSKFFLNANAVSFNKKEAMTKALMEEIERLSFVKKEKSDLYYGSYQQMLNQFPKEEIIDPKLLIYFTKKQLSYKKYRHYIFSKEKKIWWTKVEKFNISKNTISFEKNVFIPAHLIYFLDYDQLKKKDEYLFKISDSNGLSAGFEYQETLYRSLLELIERDVYTISFFLKLKPKIIFKESLKKLSIFNLIKYIESYNFKIHLLYLNIDFQIPVILSILEDKTGYFPKIVVGAKADLDIIKAIEGAILESLQGLISLRDLNFSQLRKNFEFIYYLHPASEYIIKRLIFWAKKGDIKLFNFWLKSNEKLDIFSYLNKNKKYWSIDQKLNTIFQDLFKKNIKNIFIKKKFFKFSNKKQIYVLKCVIPNLCPLFINQDFKYLNNERFKSFLSKFKVKSINNFLHPLP